MVVCLPGAMVHFVSLTESRIPWEETLNEGLSRLGEYEGVPVGVSVGHLRAFLWGLS